ncbi:MAG: ATP synthase subunit C [Candidatus Ratteibacteria bacterium]|jgi:V/A-type H+-transporting ATPase subunit K
MKSNLALYGAKVTALFFALGACSIAFAQTTTPSPETLKWAYLSAAIVTSISTLAAAIAVSFVGAAAVGAMSEKPELAGRALIYVGLAEGVAIYGLIISIMILTKV